MSPSEPSATTGETPTGTWNAVAELSPSAKLVAKVLEYNDRMTQREIVAKTLLPERTVRYALSQLDGAGVINSEISFRDARQKIYALSVDEPSE